MIRVLSIDDSKAVHAYLKSCFQEVPHQLHHAYSGKEGLETALKISNQIDLVLLDWEMPEMTGPEVLEALMKSGFKIPVIMLTSKNDADNIMKMLEIGAKEYIMKPFTADIVFEKIEQVTGISVKTQ